MFSVTVVDGFFLNIGRGTYDLKYGVITAQVCSDN